MPNTGGENTGKHLWASGLRNKPVPRACHSGSQSTIRDMKQLSLGDSKCVWKCQTPTPRPGRSPAKPQLLDCHRERVDCHHSLKSHPTPTARDMARWLNFCSPSSPFTSISTGNKFRLLRSGLLVAITRKWFLCLCLSHWAFSYYFLLHPTREEEIKRSWPRSAHHTREEQEIITKMQLWKKNLSLVWIFFIIIFYFFVNQNNHPT